MSYIRHINENGGIHGRKIRVIAYDDQYDPPQCVYNTQKLIVEDKVFSLFCYVGTPTTVKIVPMVEEAGIPLLGIFTGAEALREPPKRYLINVRASYYQETAALVDYIVNKLKISKVAVFYQYDLFGFEGLKGAELALKSHDIVPVAKGTYTRGTLKIEEGLEKIMESGAESVIMIGTYHPCARFIKMSRTKGFNPVFCSVSFVGATEMARILGKEGDGVIVTQVVPSPDFSGKGDGLRGVIEYRKHLKMYYPENELGFVGLEGYLNARVLVEGLKRAGRDLNRGQFIDAVESIQNYDLGIEATLSFSPSDHQGLEKVYFTRIENGQIKVMTDM